MIRNRDILSSLPMLASILGDQYGIEVRIGGSEAKTNGKIIYLPSLPLDCDRDLVALARGFLDHEAAHIRHTDFQAIKAARMNPVTFNLFNTLEDWRIEQRLAAIFPGCRQNLHWLIRRLFLEDKEREPQDAEAESPAIVALRYVLLTVRAWDVPELSGRVSGVGQMLDRLFPGLRGQMDEILKDVQGSCPDTKEAIDYARRLAACLQNWQPPTSEAEEQQRSADNEDQPSGRGTGSRQGNGKESQRQEAGPGEAGEEGNDGPPDCASEAQPTDGRNDVGSLSPEQALGELSSLFSMVSDQLPAGTGELVSASLEENACEIPANGINVAIRGPLHREPLSENDKLEALQTSIALRTRFCSLLQTQTQRRCQPAQRTAEPVKPLSPEHRKSQGLPKGSNPNRDRYGGPCAAGCQRQHEWRTHAPRLSCLLRCGEGS